MKLLGSTESKITGEKNGENVLHLEVVEVVLIHCNIVDNSYQQNSRILYTFVTNKSATDAFKIASKTAIQKTTQATGDLIGKKIADKILSYSKRPANEPHSNDVSNEIPKERYISPQERQKIIDELRLI